MPTLPANAVEVATEHGGCPDGPGGWRTFYDLDGDPSEAEIVTYGPDSSARPVLWVFFTPGKPVADRIVLTLPGAPAQDVTTEQIDDQYGGLCAIFNSLA
jgi:hypothetical protein